MLNSNPAAFPESPPSSLSVSINNGIRKRLVVTMSCDPITGSRIILSRFSGKILLNTNPISRNQRPSFHCRLLIAD